MVPVVGLVIVGPVVVETHIYIYMYICMYVCMYVYLIVISVSPWAKKLCRMQDAEYLKNLWKKHIIKANLVVENKLGQSKQSS